MPRKLFLSLVIFALVVLLGVVFFYWSRSRATQGLDLEIKSPQQVLLGVPFDVTITIANRSRSVLEEARLSLRLPDGLAFIGSETDKNLENRELGNLGAGSLRDEVFKIIVVSGENTIKRLEADLSYSPGSIGSRFEKNAALDISVSKNALALDIVAPQKVLSGESFDLEVSYQNNADTELSGLTLKIDYPPTFKFEKSTLAPDSGNNMWDLGALRPRSEMRFTIKGSLIGPDNAFFDFESLAEAQFADHSYTVSKNSATVSISPSPLSLQISLNESPDFVAAPSNTLAYTIVYANNTDVGLRDAIITARLVGTMFDFSSLSGNGIYRSTDNTLTWNAANHQPLGLIGPGQSGSVSFSIGVLSTYPIRRLGDRNFTLKVMGEIESPTVPYFLAADKTTGLSSLETKIAGDIAVQTKVLFRDAQSGVLNSGPLPPRVNVPTQFTVHWIVKNFSTDVSEVEVRSFLDGDTRFVKIVKNNSQAEPIYNPRTQELVWLIGKIGATKGTLDAPVEVIFQIETVPSANMAGRQAPLIKDTTIRAVDDFTGLVLNRTYPARNTSIPDDPTLDFDDGIVVP